MDLSPARWIWFPSQRTLPNSFVLFRRQITLDAAPRTAVGWVLADSRYRLTVNGQRVQWGPAPSDPRWQEVDPVDITALLQPGTNTIGVEVLYYGEGDGTWALGRPGLIFRLDIEHADGRCEQVVSDESWLTYLDRAHRPGQFRRWFLRALQEQFDARLRPEGWDAPQFRPDKRWLPAMLLRGAADKPSMQTSGPDYLLGADSADNTARLRPRSIPLLQNVEIPAARMTESGRVTWLRDPDDWFESRTPGSMTVERADVAHPLDSGRWTLPAASDPSIAAFITFEFAEQLVGWPYFTIDAPAGTVVELMCQESHDPVGPHPWLDTHIYAWSRFICREGINRFEEFDFESLRWLQLHVRNNTRPVTISGVGVRRRLYPWPAPATIRIEEPALQRLMDASVNTLNNSAQETIVDGMGRERQQYSGDCGHQLFALRYGFGETRLPVRFLSTFSQGMTLDGYFLDCWPGYDRLARLMQRQVGATVWGPILDHGVQLNFDCWWHYMDTGDLDVLREPYPRLLRFAEYLESIRQPDGLLPVENIGVPSVWIDHHAYQKQRHKQCAFNLYTAAMAEHALANIARAFGDTHRAEQFVLWGRETLNATIDEFWSEEHGLFINNLPWLEDEKQRRLDDRSLATAVLFDQCPAARVEPALGVLADCPTDMGLSYPANAGWRLWALAKLGRVDVVLRDLRTRWATMSSVIHNNTLQEEWQAKPDTGDQWSHCPVAPMYVLFMDICGIRPLAPGFSRCQIRPQLGDLPSIDVTAQTVRGPIHFQAQRTSGGHDVALTLPAGIEAELLLPPTASADFPAIQPDHPLGLKRLRLPIGRCEFRL